MPRGLTGVVSVCLMFEFTEKQKFINFAHRAFCTSSRDETSSDYGSVLCEELTMNIHLRTLLFSFFIVRVRCESDTICKAYVAIFDFSFDRQQKCIILIFTREMYNNR